MSPDPKPFQGTVISDSPRAQVRLSHQVTNSRERWDLRLWLEYQEIPGMWHTTRKGISLRRHELAPLIAALQQALGGAI